MPRHRSVRFANKSLAGYPGEQARTFESRYGSITIRRTRGYW